MDGGTVDNLERLLKIERLVKKRLMNFDYIERLHSGKPPLFWLNTIKLRQSDLLAHHEDSTLQARARRWFILGMSLSNLIQLPTGGHIVRAAHQLLTEFEYYFSNAAMQVRLWQGQVPVLFDLNLNLNS